MYNIIVLKITHYFANRVALPDMGQELIAQPFTLVGALDQSCYIHELNSGWQDFFGLGYGSNLVKAAIRNLNHADVRVNSAKGVIGCFCLFLRQSIKKRGFAHIWQAHDAD
jgi:hypothetical protein